MKTKSQLLLFLISHLFFGNLFAQRNTVSTGGDASGSGGTVSYSVGQIDYSSTSGSSGTIHQGVQQPLEFFNLSIKENSFDFAVLIYPNPVVAELHVDLAGISLDFLSFNLTDASGKMIENQAILHEKFTLNMTELSRANYFLNFIKNGKVVGSYQLIKN